MFLLSLRCSKKSWKWSSQTVHKSKQIKKEEFYMTTACAGHCWSLKRSQFTFESKEDVLKITILQMFSFIFLLIKDMFWKKLYKIPSRLMLKNVFYKEKVTFKSFSTDAHGWKCSVVQKVSVGVNVCKSRDLTKNNLFWIMCPRDQRIG